MKNGVVCCRIKCKMKANAESAIQSVTSVMGPPPIILHTHSSQLTHVQAWKVLFRAAKGLWLNEHVSKTSITSW